jgi:hypothetical protein
MTSYDELRVFIAAPPAIIGRVYFARPLKGRISFPPEQVEPELVLDGHTRSARNLG